VHKEGRDRVGESRLKNKNECGIYNMGKNEKINLVQLAKENIERARPDQPVYFMAHSNRTYLWLK